MTLSSAAGAARATFAVLALVIGSVGCGEGPPPPARSTAPRNVRVHVANGSRFDLCRIEACGQPGRAIDTQGPTPGNPPLKPHAAAMYEVRECKTGTLVVVACPDPAEPQAQPPCLKAAGGGVLDGEMFRVAPCGL